MDISRGRCLLGELIEAKGWTKAEYARRSGRSKRMISYICAGKTPMTPEDIYIAEELLDCTFRDLYEGFKKSKPAD
ncbi:Helix-turn-helix transcriptional regulator [Cohnella lubricantis]|uniref:Helix-turn-helix transcriptional regulator n=1 Tax=Cohnella lubricantis TaxID=2163172 RepID=A0A841TGF5_9BACL|nr:helix-turn-helix transcriptional regulator [Cohnella lubricantis]MBP2116573.1 transcriptional regulator with XRE-family HTH domain [Cohnella lubricantis]